MSILIRALVACCANGDAVVLRVHPAQPNRTYAWRATIMATDGTPIFDPEHGDIVLARTGDSPSAALVALECLCNQYNWDN